MSAIQISHFNRNIPIAKLRNQNAPISRQKKLIDSVQMASISTTLFLKSFNSKSFTRSTIPNSSKNKEGGPQKKFLDTPEASAKSYSLLKVKSSGNVKVKQQQPVIINQTRNISNGITSTSKNNFPEIQTLSSLNLETPMKITHSILFINS